MNMTIKTQTLPPPEVRSYNESGVGEVDVADPNKPLEILVGPIDMSQKDRIDLYWGANEGPVATYFHSPNAPSTNGIFSLYVPTRFIEPGVIDIYYVLTPFPSVVPQQSESLSVVVKLAAPGGRDPDPESPYQNESLSRPIITPPGTISLPTGVLATIAPYENMSIGDNIALYWNGVKINVPALTKEQLDKPVQIPVSKDVILEAGDSDSIPVRYDIRDVVNNWSRWSLPTYVEVEAGNSALPAPVAPQAANMELNLGTLAGADVQALVLSYPGIHSTDEITFTVERNTAEGMGLESYVAVKPVGTSVGFVQFLIPNEQFAPIAQGRARLKYKVKKVSGDEFRSKSLPLTIVGEAQVLAPPKLPVAEQNNGVLDPTAHNVIAHVPPYYFMADGNDVTLVWMGKTAGGANVIHEELKNLNSDDVGQTVAFLIPDDKVSALAGGTLELYYTVTTFARAFFKSPSLLVQVSAGGSTLLRAPAVDGASADGVLDPADIVLEAVVRIAPYTGMAPLDKVTLHWEGRAPEGVYSANTTLNSGTSGKEVIFRVKKRYVDANLNGSVAVRYEVVRGNRTFTSETLPLTIGATVVTPLPDPTVKEAKEGTLDPANTVNGATVVIDASAHLKVGDVVAVAWEGSGGSDNKEKTITAQQAGKQVPVIFSGALVAANVGNKVSISYAVKRATGADQRSGTLKLLVTGGLSNMAKPAVAGVDAHDIMIPENVPETGVVVTVPSYTGMAVKDSIVVKWASGPSHTTAPQVVGVVGEINFTVPKSVAVGSAGSSAGVTYAVTRGSAASVESAATTFTVHALAPPLSLGSDHALSLSGYGVFEGRPPVNPPANAIYTRAAIGGQPPYRYQSSAPRVALVDNDGKVVAAGNGVTTVTVTDALGATASYQLTTSGARVFVGFKDVRKDSVGYRTFCDQQGVHSMSANDFKQLRAVYVGENSSVGVLLGWNNGWGCWTNEQVSSGTLGNSRAFSLDTGSIDLVSNNFQLNCFGIKK
jgi:hypothetical protein